MPITRDDLDPAIQQIFDQQTPEWQAAYLASFDKQEARRSGLRDAVPTLRQWSTDAKNTTVTAGNAVQVTQTMVNRLGVFFDRFADLLVQQGLSPE